MALRIAVTGSPGVGKSTLVQRVIEAADIQVGGVLAREKRIKDRRVGFELIDLGSGATGMLADETGNGPQLGKYRVCLGDLDRIGAKAIFDALKADLIVVDEVGPMELSSRMFVSAVEKAIVSDKPMLVILHQWSNHPLAKKIRKTFRMITVTSENRDSLELELTRELKKALTVSLDNAGK
jgi:nucleoside-triphosphatase